MAQQTSIRNVSIVAGDAAVGLDIGVFPDYQHLNAGAPYTLGGGGAVEDVAVYGGAVSMRAAATQFAYRSVLLSGGQTAGLELTTAFTTWAVAFVGLRVENTPVGVRLAGAL